MRLAATSFLTCFILIPLWGQEELFHGGAADGFAFGASDTLSPPPTFPEIFDGGSADGFAKNANGALSPPQTFTETFGGGSADGFAKNASGALSPPQTFTETFGGGSADGFATGASGVLLPPSEGAEVFAGGLADGFASGASGTISPTVTFSELFEGANADGFASGASGALSPPVTFSELFEGAAADGFAFLASGAVSPPPTYSQVYGGGSADGMDSASGSLPAPNDLGVAAILSPSTGTPFAATSQPVSLTLKNYGTDVITTAQVQWKVNNVAQPPHTWNGSLAPGAQTTTTIGSHVFTVGIPHDVVAWTFQPNGSPDPLWFNDTAKVEGLYAALDGTYTLGGASPDFPTFQAAAASLNKGGVLGDVTIEVRNGIYNEQITLNAISGASAANTVTFQSEALDSTAATLTFSPTASANYVVRLDGTNWVALKHLKFHTPNQPSSTAIVLQNGASHLTLSNNWLVSDGHQNPLVDDAGAHAVFTQNRFENGSQGVAFQNVAPHLPGVQITDNSFLNQTDFGLALHFGDGALVSRNTFSTNVASPGYFAISAQNCQNATRILKNSIAANAGYGIALQSSSGAAADRLLVANNMVSIAGGSEPTSGILLNASLADVWHNSVRHGGNHADSRAFFAEGGSGVELKNNAFFHAGSGKTIAVNAPGILSASNFNDFFAGASATLGNWAGTSVSTLAAWQAQSGQDANSLSVNPLFISPTNLHTQQAQLNGAGTPIAAVAQDIDGEPRNASTPDIGADEIGALPDDLGVVSISSPVSGCALGAAATVTVTVQNFGSTPQPSFNVAYKLGTNAPVTENFGGSPLPPGGSSTFTFSTPVNLSAFGNHVLRVFTILTGDNLHLNDTATVTVTNAQMPAAPAGFLPSDNSVNVPVSPSLSWQPSASATSYSLSLWQSSQAEPASPTAPNLTQISYVVSPPLAFGTNYNWRVTANNAWCSTPGSLLDFTTVHLPDIAPLNLAATSSPTSGQQVAVQWNTKNQGLGATSGGWGESVYLSLDAVFDGDIFLGSVGNFSALNPNDVFSNMLNVTLPANQAGDFYLILVLDPWNNLPESNDANNVIFIPYHINLTPPPDLEVTAIGTPPAGVAASGQPMPFNWTVANTGDGPTISGGWVDRFFYSASAIFQPATAIFFGEKYHAGNLALNVSYADNSVWNIPNGLSGTHYIFVKTDIHNWEYEHAYEGNNTSGSAAFSVFVPGTPDLKVTSVVPPVSGSNKQPLNFQWTVKNEGLAGALPNWRDKVYLSQTQNESNLGSAIFLGEKMHNDTLSPDESATVSMSFALPDGITGAYYVHVFTDANDQVFEYLSANSNNVGHSTGPVQVVTPDLTVQSIVAEDTTQAGSTLSVFWTLKNQSPTATLLDGLWTDRIYISPSPAPNLGVITELAAVTSATAALLPNGTLLRQATVQIPGGISGQRYLHVQTDYLSQVYEQTGETNNVSSAGAPVFVVAAPAPDLLPGALTPGAGAAAGAPLAFSFTIQNAGSAVAQGTAWEDKVYLQNSPTFNLAQAILLSTFNVIQTVTPGGSYTTAGSATLPPTLPAGTYFLFVKTDAANALFENTGENNNLLGSAGFVVSPYPPVDLAVENVASPDTAVTGQPFGVQFSVENLAAVATPQSQWADGIFLSADSIFSAGTDVLIATIQRTQALAGSNSYAVSTTIFIPGGTQSGTYWLIAVADYQFLNSDSNAGNNAGIRRNAGMVALPVFVQFPPSPDLAVYGFAAPPSANSGQPFSVIYTIANQGMGATVSGGWNEVFFLSEDFTIGSDDLLLGAFSHSGNLAAGASYTDTAALTIPSQISGNRILLIATDYNNAEFENQQEGNNAAASNILVSQPPPADLVAQNVSGPAMAIAGETATFTWNAFNLGQNIAQGYRRDALYLSLDTIWQPADPLLGFLDLYFNLPPQNSTPHNLTVPVNGVAVDTYYVLVRTDIFNNIFESDDANNIAVSAQQVVVTVPLLPLGVLTPNTLFDNANLYYRIEIPPSLEDETLLVTLDGASTGVNELYLSHEAAPTRVMHDFQFSAPFSGDQEILVPSLQAGTYYLLAYGSTSPGNQQAITLKAEIIDFQILSVQAGQGGNSGSVTLKIKGAKFVEGMTLKLKKGAATIIAHSVYFTNATQVYASFNLAGAALGFYDVEAIKSGGAAATLPNGFEVVAGSVTGTSSGGGAGGFYCNIENIGAGELTAMNVQHPAGTRPNWLVAMQIHYGNNGNVDIPAPVRFIVSLGGAPLAFVLAELPQNHQELQLNFNEEGGPPGILRPGVTGTIHLMSKAIAPLQFTIVGN